MDLDAFFASVEMLDHPEWRGKPLIVGGDPTKRGVVSTASYEARKYGVHSAMPSSTAARLCPHAIWTPGRHWRYREMSEKVMQILVDESPFLQQVSVDEAFLDITPTAYHKEHPVSIANRIQSRVSELGISCSIGLGTSKTVAKIASDMDKPKGFTVVYPGTERDFLSPLPIKVMSGIGKQSQAFLKKYGIQTLGELSEAEDIILRNAFGKNADIMRNRCLGIDESRVESDDEVKSVSNEMSFAEDISSRADVEAAIGTAAAKVARRLRKKGLEASTLTLKLKYHDFHNQSAQTQLATPTDDEYVMTAHLKVLLNKVWLEGTPLRLVGVGTSGFEGQEFIQDSLFEDEEITDAVKNLPNQKKRQGLINATDAIRDRFGENALSFGRETKTKRNTTGTAAKNPNDYK